MHKKEHMRNSNDGFRGRRSCRRIIAPLAYVRTFKF